jgi:hypothetical protein
MTLVMTAAASARGESILQINQAPKNKAAVKATGNTFSVRAMPAKDESEFDRFAPYLLGGKKEQPSAAAASKKKASPPPPVEWNEKQAKKAKLKGIKLPKKPPKHEPAPLAPVQWAQAPTPMAPAAMELGATVPAPQALWGGLAMMGALGIWRWWARGTRAI